MVETQMIIVVVVLQLAMAGKCFGQQNVLPSSKAVDAFKTEWCRQRAWRLDWEKLWEPCKDKMTYNKSDNGNLWTDPEKTETYNYNIRPAGEFSKFLIRTKTKSGIPKTVGGDSWRVRFQGPNAASLAGTVYDHNNGTYEVVALFMDPGLYQITATLDYSMCNGFKDPPMDWFQKAHCSGKNKNVDLGKELFSSMAGYINKAIPATSVTPITVPNSTVTSSVLQKWIRDADNSCSRHCNMMWDGFGRWLGLTWYPFMEVTKNDYLKDVANLRKSYHHKVGKGIFYIYGDSLSYYFYLDVKGVNRTLCAEVFQSCRVSYNWIYPKTLYEMTETCKEMDLDIPKILGYFRNVTRCEDLDEDSALLFNAGAHYVKTTHFENYRGAIDAFAQEVKSHCRAKPVWRTTTAMHSQTGDLMGSFRRFITNQRVQLYNAYANDAMCKAGVTILDVYPFTESFPWGTPDGIHYSGSAWEPAEQLLESYFSMST